MSKRAARKASAPRAIAWLQARLPTVKEGSFAWNSVFTSARSLVTILAQLIFTPIIVRLYTPEAYGAFGFIFSVSTILLSLFTLQYEKAMFLPNREKEIHALRSVCNALPLYFALLLALALFLAQGPLLRLAGVEGLGHGIFLIPILIVAGAWSQSSQRMVSVRYLYKEGFLYGSLVTVGGKLTAILYGALVGSHYVGLALAELFNKLLLQVVNSRIILREARLITWDDLNLRRHWWVMRKYSSFPRFELPAVVLNAISNKTPIFWIPYSYGLAQLGQYSLAMALLEMPMRLFGYSLSNTFYQKAARTHEVQGLRSLARITYRMMAWIGMVGFLPMLCIALFAEPIFTWVFGQQWAVSGALSSSLAIFYFVRLVVEPVVPALRVLGLQSDYLRFQILLFVSRLTIVLVLMALEKDLVTSITLYAIQNALMYAGLAVFIVRQLHTKGTGTAAKAGMDA
jgi:O-antigen/teichoic acid export membrane protein